MGKSPQTYYLASCAPRKDLRGPGASLVCGTRGRGQAATVVRCHHRPPVESLTKLIDFARQRESLLFVRDHALVPAS